MGTHATLPSTEQPAAPSRAAQPAGRRTRQFSLASLLAATSAVAIVLAIWRMQGLRPFSWFLFYAYAMAPAFAFVLGISNPRVASRDRAAVAVLILFVFVLAASVPAALLAGSEGMGAVFTIAAVFWTPQVLFYVVWRVFRRAASKPHTLRNRRAS